MAKKGRPIAVVKGLNVYSAIMTRLLCDATDWQFLVFNHAKLTEIALKSPVYSWDLCNNIFVQIQKWLWNRLTWHGSNQTLTLSLKWHRNGSGSIYLWYANRFRFGSYLGDSFGSSGCTFQFTGPWIRIYQAYCTLVVFSFLARINRVSIFHKPIVSFVLHIL